MPLNVFLLLPPGLRYMALSALGFALMTACVKAVSVYNIPVMEIVAARALVSLVLSYIDVRRKKISIWGTHKSLLIGRGVAGTLAMMAIYYTVTVMPLAEATVIQYLHPVFTAVLALIFLKEKVRSTTILAIVISLTGLGVVVMPTIDPDIVANFSPIALGTALFGAFGSAVAYVIVRCLAQKNEDGSVIIFYFPLVALPMSLILLGDDFVMPDLWPAFLLLMLGVFTQIGQIGLTKAMKCDDAAIATAYSYVQVIFSAALGWVFFDEIPLITTVLGGALIIIGALVNVLGGRMARKLASAEAR
ncbi:DMT family transporter [Parendozoicomonas haliclonae]|uniref:Aromatic amino acid exporter n=1 Tax=Parendozoicomonas haliclonae TaxID=1960125 RepID=A0A1X7AHF6_9GAMM|nr:DMT family transporter [Parendozoicomonas haliclonae]SMA42723.1 aromatic amino acid exporter [Parendozoicomonas haliclonae]